MAKERLETVFAPELTKLAGKKRQELCEGLHAVSIWSFWESLRTELGLSPDQAENLVRATVTALLAGGRIRLLIRVHGQSDDLQCRRPLNLHA